MKRHMLIAAAAAITALTTAAHGPTATDTTTAMDITTLPSMTPVIEPVGMVPPPNYWI
jgi:hypothetical protein